MTDTFKPLKDLVEEWKGRSFIASPGECASQLSKALADIDGQGEPIKERWVSVDPKELAHDLIMIERPLEQEVTDKTQAISLMVIATVHIEKMREKYSLPPDTSLPSPPLDPKACGNPECKNGKVPYRDGYIMPCPDCVREGRGG